MLFAHSHSPSVLYFIIIPSVLLSLPCLVKTTPFPKSILLTLKFPTTTIPPSLDFTIEFILFRSLPPITFAHSISPLALYFIIIASSSPFFVKVSPFSNLILLLLKYPPTTIPLSFVSATDFIWSNPSPPTPLAHSTSPFLSYFIINPSA